MSNDYGRKTDRTSRGNIVLEITIIAIIILTANNRRNIRRNELPSGYCYPFDLENKRQVEPYDRQIWKRNRLFKDFPDRQM